MRVLFHAPGLAVFRPDIPLHPILGTQPMAAQSLAALLPNHRLTGNRGNIIHAEAPAKMLASDQTRSAYANIGALHRLHSADLGHVLSEHFDMIVISMANFIRLGHDGATLAAALKALDGRVPFVVLGAGLQGTHPIKEMLPGNRDLIAVMNERAAIFGVRGEKTAAWLDEHRFSKAKVLGCPSLYVYPQSILSIDGRAARAKGAAADIMTAGHLSLHQGRIQARGHRLVEALSGLRASYVFQDEFFGFGQMAARNFSYNEGSNTADAGLVNRWLNSRHKLGARFRRYYYFTESGAWRQASLNHDLFLGDRFHGGVAVLQAGQPAIFLKQDNRVSELTAHFGLPNLSIEEFVQKGIERTLEEHLSDEALTQMKQLYRQRHHEFSETLAAHGLKVVTALPPETATAPAATPAPARTAPSPRIVSSSAKVAANPTAPVFSWLDHYALRQISTPGAKTVVISFEAADTTINRSDLQRPGFGEAFLTAQGHAVLSVLCDQANWYRPQDFIDHLRQSDLRDWLQSYETRISYGSSMGGFAACAFAELLSVDTVVALQPISSLAADLAPWETRFGPGRQLDWSGPFRDGAEGLAKVRAVYTLYDPESPDQRHADRLAAAAGTRMRRIPIRGARHAVPLFLQERGLLRPVVQACMQERPVAEIAALLASKA